MQVFYQPPHARVGDVIPYSEDGALNLFYLKNWNHYAGEDRAEGWHCLASADLVNFIESPTGIAGGTGCVIKSAGVWHMFYCTFQDNPQRQWICHAVSRDGMRTWSALDGERFGPDGQFYLPTDWRDPFVFWNDKEHCWWMLTCALARGATKRRGCVGLCKSDDLHAWRACPPLYAPEASMGAYECPELFRMGDWYYLVFSQFTDGFHTVYRMSRSVCGPWVAPERDTFDGRAYYAAKSCPNGDSRYLFGWAPTRLGQAPQLNPGREYGYDYRTWDWGGTMVVHELWQQPDGALGVRPPQTVRDAFRVRNRLRWQPVGGEWALSENGASVSAWQGYAALLSWNDVPRLARLAFDFRFANGTDRVGLAVQADESVTDAYYFYFEPSRARMEWKSRLRMSEPGNWIFPWDVELERPVRLEPESTHHVELYVQDTLMAIYVDGCVALCTRGYELHDRRFALLVSDGEAEFSNLSLTTAKGE